MELIGTDVTAFCDELVKDSLAHADVYQESISARPGTTEKERPDVAIGRL